jgi:signal transduction histidine kinase
LADEMRLIRVLANLLDNAVRACRSGGTTIRVATLSEGEMFVICVEDDGPGVSPELVPRLFEKFARTRSGGTGIGLFFSRISVENWGGGIGYERSKTGGARFWIRLRRAQPREWHKEDA